jgi:hypothetical protein
MNIKTGSVIVSASLAMIATHAMITAARSNDPSLASFSQAKGEKSDLRKRIDTVVAQRDAKMEISSAMMLLATRFGENEVSIAQKYFPHEFLVAQAVKQGDDFTLNGNANVTDPSVIYPGVSCHSACHNACHSACHGSRGWR